MQKNFELFYQKIKLTARQRADAKVKYRGVCKTLHDFYYPSVEYSGTTKLLIGSYGKHTNIRPPLDVDVLFKMPESEFGRYDSYGSNGQSQLLQDIRGVLRETYTTTETVCGWGKVVLIEFSDGTHNVELLPAWENEDGSFKIPNTENGGTWEDWNPRIEIEKINESDRVSHGLTRFLIRVIKKWKQGCSVKMKSFEIEEKVTIFLDNNDYTGKNHSVLVRDFFSFLLGSENDEVRKSHMSTAFGRAVKACEYEDAGSFDAAVAEWKKVFGDDFPSMALVKSTETALVGRCSPTSPDYSINEEYIEDYYPINIQNSVQVSCLVDQDGFRPSLLEKLPYLKRDKKLEFSAKTDVIPPFSMKWKVRNFGDEARLAKDLRGEISNDQGRMHKIEHTRYKGGHYVECYVIKDDVCVARGHKEVPIEILKKAL